MAVKYDGGAFKGDNILLRKIAVGLPGLRYCFAQANMLITTIASSNKEISDLRKNDLNEYFGAVIAMSLGV